MSFWQRECMEITLGGIAGLIAALAFAVLVIYLARVLSNVNRTLGSVANTTENLERQLDGITMEVTSLLHKTNRLLDQVEEKTALLTPVAHALDELGTSLNEVTESVRTITVSVNTAADENKEQIAQAVKWGTVAMEVIKKNRSTEGETDKKAGRRSRRGRKARSEEVQTEATPDVSDENKQ